MDSFVFNSFKEKLINGKVNKTDTWYLWPVNKKFVDNTNENLAYIRTSAEFNLLNIKTNKNINSFSDYQTNLYPINYKYISMIQSDTPSEPEFVTTDSFDTFLNNNPGNEHLKELFFNPTGAYYRIYKTKEEITIDGKTINVDVPMGFYAIRTQEELKWCANKVNGDVYNNKINIVLLDNIGIDTKGNIEQNEIIDFYIGSKPEQPYEGIFFGNGYKILNVTLLCTKVCNGIIGYLGKNGVISTIDIDGNNVIKCNKDLSLTHLINDSGDINAGLLCGKNNGSIQHVRINGKIYVNGFIPKIYSVCNKTEDNLAYGDNKNNTYYPDYLCFNSLGNIIPYVGYFNEGVFATFSGTNKAINNNTIQFYWNTSGINSNNTFGYPVKEYNGLNSPAEWYYWEGIPCEQIGGYKAYSYTNIDNKKNVLFYDSTIFKNCNETETNAPNLSISNLGLLLWDNTDSYNGFKTIEYAQYFNKSIKLNQQNRAAYYVSPLIGNNNGFINQITENCNITLSGTFVGFIGGIAGKQCNGEINNSTLNITASDCINTVNSNTYYTRDYYDTRKENTNNSHYYFPQKSIKNIGGLFGSYVVGSLHSLILNNISANFNNDNKIAFTNSKPIYDDYYCMNRYATFAAMCEYNSCNISDMWFGINNVVNSNNEPMTHLGVLNNDIYRSCIVNNCSFTYNETNDIENTNKLILGINSIYQKNMPGIENYMYGVVSPLIAEIKPNYLAVPSIISTPFGNQAKIYNKGLNESYDRIGLYTMDQNLASPITDPNFWSINTEVDLPGVANSPYYSDQDKYNFKQWGVAGGVVDRMNNTAGKNFDINIQNIASKLIKWNNTTFSNNFTNLFESVMVPAAAYITKGGDNGANVYNTYKANKYLTTYPYFGSDLKINTVTSNIAIDTDMYNTDIKIFECRIHYADGKFNCRAPSGGTYKEGSYNITAGYDHNYANNIDEQDTVMYIRVNCDILNNYKEFNKYASDSLAIKDSVTRNNILSTNIKAYSSINDAYALSNELEFEQIPSDDAVYNIYENHSGYCIKLFDEEYNTKMSSESDFTAKGYWFLPITYEYSAGYDIFTKFDFSTRYRMDHIRWTNSDKLSKRFYRSTELIASNTDIVPNVSAQIDSITILYDYIKDDAGNYKIYYKYGYDNAQNPLYRDTELTNTSARTNTSMTGYKTAGKDGDYIIFLLNDGTTAKKIKKDDLASTNIATGYAQDYSTISGYCEDENHVYKTFSNIGDTPTPLIEYAFIIENCDPDNYNWVIQTEWETDKYNTISSYKTKNNIYSNILITAANIDITSYSGKSYDALNLTGSYYNDLLCSNSYTDTGISYISTVNKYNDISATDAWFTGAPLDYNRKRADVANVSDTTNYFKYTYIKGIYKDTNNNIGKQGIKLPVEYGYYNNKAGFWFKDANNDGVYFNDEIKYNGNILHIGTTLNQDCILNTHLKQGKYYDGFVVSGFSADDFEGIYITDSNKNPVMYIDVGLGNCYEGQSWSLSSYPSKTDASGNSLTGSYGLLMEIG